MIRPEDRNKPLPMPGQGEALSRGGAGAEIAAARIFLGALFIFACYDKILHPEAFAQAVYNYRILPDVLVNLAAVALPWLELAVGLLLVANRWTAGAALLSTSLLGVFLVALIFNQVRGLDAHCGCFSTQSGQEPANWWTVARDSVFFLVSVFVLKTFLTGSHLKRSSATE